MAMLGRALRSGERRRRLLAGGLAPMPAPQVSGAAGRRARAGLPPPLSCLSPASPPALRGSDGGFRALGEPGEGRASGGCLLGAALPGPGQALWWKLAA